MKSLGSLARWVILAPLCFAGLDARADVEPGPPPFLLPGALPAVPLPAPPPDCLPPDPPPPVVRVKVRVPAFNAPGQAIEYRICVENCSTAEAHHVLLKNPLPANAKFVRADPEPTALTPELQWQLGTIGGGACREVTLVLQPTNQEDVKNCTRVQFEHGQCVTTRQAGYPPAALPPGVVPPEKGPPAVMPPATGEPPGAPSAAFPRLGLTIEGHQRQYVNLASHYFITVTNPGKTRAANVLISCVVPDQTRFVRATQNWKFVEGQVAWVLGDLEPGEQRMVELVLKAVSEGRYCVQATARADRGVTAATEACTQFIGVSAMHVEVADRDDPLVVGGKTSYAVQVRNQGSAAVTNLRLKVLIPSKLKLLDVKGPTAFRLGDKTAQGQWVEMAAMGKLDAMTSQTYEIFVEAQGVGEARLRVEVSADQLERGPVIEEENTTLFEDEPPR